MFNEIYTVINYMRKKLSMDNKNNKIHLKIEIL